MRASGGAGWRRALAAGGAGGAGGAAGAAGAPKTAVRPGAEAEALRSLHADTPLVMALANADPSLALGFFCRDRADFEDLQRRAAELGRNAIFSVAASPPDFSGAMACMDDERADREEGEDEEDEYILVDFS